MRENLLFKKDGFKTVSENRIYTTYEPGLWQRLVLFNFIQFHGSKSKNASLEGEEGASSLNKAELSPLMLYCMQIICGIKIP